MFRIIFAVFLLLAVLINPALAKSPNVVASIKPIHSLVAMVMKGVGDPYLLIANNSSPHDYVLRPSDASALEKAAVVFWIGPQLEASLTRPLKTLATNAKIVSFADVDTMIRLPLTGANGTNMHFWLDPRNAISMVEKIAGQLGLIDPDNGGLYRQNALKAIKKLRNLTREISAILKPVSGRKFITFHNAYRYFEQRFSMPAVTSITINPQTAPGVKRVEQIQQLIASRNVRCIFSEPQFSPRLIKAISEGSKVKIGVLDPLGANLAPGPRLYFKLLRNIANSMRDCLQN